MRSFAKEWKMTRQAYGTALVTVFVCAMGVAVSRAVQATQVELPLALMILLVPIGALAAILAARALGGEFAHAVLPFATARPIPARDLLLPKYLVGVLETASLAATAGIVLIAGMRATAFGAGDLWPLGAAVLAYPMFFLVSALGRASRVETYLAATVIVLSVIFGGTSYPSPAWAAGIVLVLVCPWIAERLHASPRAQSLAYLLLLSVAGTILLAIATLYGGLALGGWLMPANSEYAPGYWGWYQRADFLVSWLAPVVWVAAMHAIGPYAVGEPGAAPWAAGIIPAAITTIAAFLVSLRMARSFATSRAELAFASGAALLFGWPAAGALALAKLREITPDRAFRHWNAMANPAWSQARFLAARLAAVALMAALAITFAVVFPTSPLAGAWKPSPESWQVWSLADGAVAVADGSSWGEGPGGWKRLEAPGMPRRDNVGQESRNGTFLVHRDGNYEDPAIHIGPVDGGRSLASPFHVNVRNDSIVRAGKDGWILIPRRWDTPNANRIFRLDTATGSWRAERRPGTGGWEDGRIVAFPAVRSETEAIGVTSRGVAVVHAARGPGWKWEPLPGFPAGATARGVFTHSLPDGDGVAVFVHDPGRTPTVYRFRGGTAKAVPVQDLDWSRLLDRADMAFWRQEGSALWLPLRARKAGLCEFLKFDPAKLTTSVATFRGEYMQREPIAWISDRSLGRTSHAAGTASGRITVLRPDRGPETVAVDRVLGRTRGAGDSAWIFATRGGGKVAFRWDGERLAETSAPFWK